MRILVILTCFNRKEKTKKCVEGLVEGNREHSFTFVVVDDNSTDGTGEMLESMKPEYDIYILKGDGKLFYSGGMRKGMDYALESMEPEYGYLLMVNDDVSFMDGCISKMIVQSRQQGGAVIVGAMCDAGKALTYSAVKYTKGIRYRNLDIREWNVAADTFNANGVLIPFEIFRTVGSLDGHYIHSLGDFDYGLSVKGAGYNIYVSKEYVGICEKNSMSGGWLDNSLSRKERFKKKESIKGAPMKQWFYFLRKNFGLVEAVRGGITPYVRILIGR